MSRHVIPSEEGDDTELNIVNHAPSSISNQRRAVRVGLIVLVIPLLSIYTYILRRNCIQRESANNTPYDIPIYPHAVVGKPNDPEFLGNPPPVESFTDISKIPYNPELGYLPNAEATEYCYRYRYDVYPHRERRRRIYDLIMVNSELDMLEIRIANSYDYVDYFIIVESTLSFSGKKKPLYVKDNWDRFEPYHEKIIRHTLDFDFSNISNPWIIEEMHRNAPFTVVFPILTSSQKPRQGDVIISSDTDEIPKPHALIALRNCDFPGLVALRSKLYYYGFQWRVGGDQEWRFGPMATIYNGSNTTLPQDMRTGAPNNIWSGGWHCSYCFGKISEIIQKIGSFSHVDLDKPRFTNRSKILYNVRYGEDLYDRGDQIYQYIADNQDIPEYVKKNSERFKYLIDRNPTSGNFEDYTIEDSYVP